MLYKGFYSSRFKTSKSALDKKESLSSRLDIFNKKTPKGIKFLAENLKFDPK